MLVPSRVPLLLLLQVLWVEGESPRLNWGLGRGLAILDPGWVGDWQVLIPAPQATNLPDRTWGPLADLLSWGGTMAVEIKGTEGPDKNGAARPYRFLGAQGEIHGHRAIVSLAF